MDKISSRITEINDLYQTCERTYVNFCIYYVDPELINQKLGIKPTDYSQKGALKIMPNGSEKIARIHTWFLGTKDLVLSKDLRRHLDWILEKIIPHEQQIIELQQIPDCKMQMRCVWWSKYGDGGPTIWPEQMEGLAKLNIELTISVGFFGEDTTESNTIKT
jgi:hypothetical protein